MNIGQREKRKASGEKHLMLLILTLLNDIVYIVQKRK